MAFRQLLYRPAKVGIGHKLFLDPETSEISVCDLSGATPELTDDGPLIVGKLQEVVTVDACFSRTVGGVHFEVSVRVPRTGETGRVWLDADTMRALPRFVRPEVRLAESFRGLSADVLFAMAHSDLGRQHMSPSSAEGWPVARLPRHAGSASVA